MLIVFLHINPFKGPYEDYNLIIQMSMWNLLKMLAAAGSIKSTGKEKL